MIDTDEYMTTADAARLVGVTGGRIRQLITAGVVTALPLVPGRNLVLRADVERYLRERRPGGRPRKEGTAM